MNVIAQKRKELGMSQQNLADLAGVDRTTVSKWEVGEAKPRASVLIKLKNILGCSIDEILRE